MRGVHTIWSKSHKYIVLFVTTAINGLAGCHANAIIGIRNTISVCNRSRLISQIHRQELRALSFKATYRLSAEKTTWWIPISLTLVLSLIQANNYHHIQLGHLTIDDWNDRLILLGIKEVFLRGLKLFVRLIGCFVKVCGKRIGWNIL